MTVEDILKKRFAAILLRETPYVLEEARFGMFDLSVYVPEDSAFEGLKESARLSAVRTCNKYQLDGTCVDKKKKFLDNFEPVHDDHCLLQGFRDKTKNILLSEHDFNMLLGDKKVVQHIIACDVDENGGGCEHLNERLHWDNGFLAGYGLKQGLHLLEFKSDHDNVNRFLEQLPHYSLFADYVWLVLGSEQKIPKWLPSYVGVYQEEGEAFVKLKESVYLQRLPPLSRAVLRECGIPDGALSDEALYAFMKKWVINSIFYRANGLVVPMNDLDQLFKSFEENKKASKQSHLF